MDGYFYHLDVADAEKLCKMIDKFGDEARDAINDVFHNEGADMIEKSIKNLMPTSGRRWKGKTPAAKSSNSLFKVCPNLAVVVKSKSRYNYLYFPDDGTNTRRHVGNQQFFYNGADVKANEIIDKCVDKIINNFEGE